MANAAYQRARAGITGLVRAPEDEQRDDEQEAAQEQPQSETIIVEIDGRFRNRAYSEGYSRGVVEARESITSGGAGCAFEAALLLDALIGERGHFREMAEGRLVGNLEEVERALDAYFDRGFKMEFAKLSGVLLRDALFGAACLCSATRQRNEAEQA